MTATMRAAVFVGSGKIEVQERPVPQPAADEVLVKVDSCALCGTDRRGFFEGSDVTPGHETSGTVVLCQIRLFHIASRSSTGHNGRRSGLCAAPTYRWSPTWGAWGGRLRRSSTRPGLSISGSGDW
ncbi:MAG: alcohol dehydrogenase catalytic domain-containing protein [Actinobacteria bacterium]|nr:alcohol dehydrogenase catalytic domain-containing protein [Actinomycetota bacterium]